MHKDDVFEHFGGRGRYGTQTKIARALGIKPPSVAAWRELIPEKQALRLDLLTEGQLTYQEHLYRPVAANDPSNREAAA